MKPLLAIAILAAVAAPIAVQGAQAPATAPAAEKRTCSVAPTIGSRVNNVRRCRTKSEREQEKIEARRTVERVQSYKPVVCRPPNPC